MPNFLCSGYAHFHYYLLKLLMTNTVAAVPCSVCLWCLSQIVISKLHLCIISLSCFKTISHKNKVWFSRGTLVCCFQSCPTTMASWIGNKGPSCRLVVYSMSIAPVSKMASHSCLFTTNTQSRTFYKQSVDIVVGYAFASFADFSHFKNYTVPIKLKWVS